MKNGWSEVPLGELLAPRNEFCAISPEGQYQEVTVSLWGKGVRLRRKVAGSEIAATERNVARAGDFIVSKIDARNGAYGFIPPDLDGGVVTNDFPLFTVVQNRIHPRWMYWICRSKFFVDLCRLASEGTTNRVRLKESKFAAMRIPLPPLAEQQRIIAHLDAIESRLTRAQKLREEISKETESFTISLHLASANNRLVRLGQLMSLDEKQEVVTPGGQYPQVGIRSFGMGLFKKPPVFGANTSYRAFNILRTGQFVMSQVKGWEGALGVADENYEGWFASPEYRTFSCIEEECNWRYLAHIVCTGWFRRHLLSATKGIGARRERVRPEILLGLEMPFPDAGSQIKAVDMLDKQLVRKRLSHESSEREAALLPSLLDQLFNS